MDIKIYRHKWVKDHKDVIYGKWYTNRLIPEEEEKYYVELSKTYHFCKSLGIEESVFEISIPEIKQIYEAEYKSNENVESVQAMSYNLATKFFGKDVVLLAESLPEFDEEFDYEDMRIECYDCHTVINFHEDEIIENNYIICTRCGKHLEILQ